MWTIVISDADALPLKRIVMSGSTPKAIRRLLEVTREYDRLADGHFYMVTLFNASDDIVHSFHIDADRAV